jgi:hypothetical protein
MSRADALARGQAAAELAMVDTCAIRRPGAETTDPFSGEVVTAYTDVYTGKCRFQQARVAQAEQQDAGQAYVLLQRSELQLPISAPAVMVGDEVTVTAAGRNPALVGKVLRVHDVPIKTDATAQRAQVQERTR